MDYFELMCISIVVGIGCYLGVVGISSITELIMFGIKQISKKQKRDRKCILRENFHDG